MHCCITVSYYPQTPVPRNPTMTGTGALRLAALSTTSSLAPSTPPPPPVSSWQLAPGKLVALLLPVGAGTSHGFSDDGHQLPLVLEDGRGARFPPPSLLELGPGAAPQTAWRS